MTDKEYLIEQLNQLSFMATNTNQILTGHNYLKLSKFLKKSHVPDDELLEQLDSDDFKDIKFSIPKVIIQTG